MSGFIDQDGFRADDDYELRAEAAVERRASRQSRHWCDLCHGHTGPNSPCYDGPEPADDQECAA